MKRIILTTMMSLALMLSFGTMQAQAQTAPTVKEQWQAAFSAEGRKNWKPELTFRAHLGPYEGAIAMTGGVRVDPLRTLGARVTLSENGSTLCPSYYGVSLAANYRRYFPLGSRGYFAFYSDTYLGLGVTYKTEPYVPDDMTIEPSMPGNLFPVMGWQFGLRLRLVGNGQVFCGTSVGLQHIGLHIGVGF